MSSAVNAPGESFTLLSGPDDNRPPRSITVKRCPGCRVLRTVCIWHPIHGGTRAGDGLGLEDDEQVTICDACFRRLQLWLDVEDTPEIGVNP